MTESAVISEDWGANYREEDRQTADWFMKVVNDDHDDIIRFNRDIGCLIRNHIEHLRIQLARAESRIIDLETERSYLGWIVNKDR